MALEVFQSVKQRTSHASSYLPVGVYEGANPQLGSSDLGRERSQLLRAQHCDVSSLRRHPKRLVGPPRDIENLTYPWLQSRVAWSWVLCDRFVDILVRSVIGA